MKPNGTKENMEVNKRIQKTLRKAKNDWTDKKKAPGDLNLPKQKGQQEIISTGWIYKYPVQM